ncbi:MAG: CHAT domain-containing protein [Candidatus Eisenbacteria bacterium]|uniref:CHAT domain-containing protein n=1 Tax=Eiseniibacteriota bacterium TaxID=2212470 RepID=A0A933S9V3_UNCEI|nr:CHAT domain-containing protein [Candidatus Eisenbacteria bacterium]
MPPTVRSNVLSITILVLSVLALAGPTPAGAARFAPKGVAAAALRLVEARRFAAAESLLAAEPAEPAGDAAVEYVRLLARTEAPGMCDTTWLWRPARVREQLARAKADALTIARADVAAARIEFRLGMWRTSAASLRTAIARMDSARVREPLLRYEAQLALAEALLVEGLDEPRAELARADSIAVAIGDAAAPLRHRQLRLSGQLAWSEGKVTEAVRRLSASVKAAELATPRQEAEAAQSLVLQGTLEAFADAPLGERHKLEAAARAEAAIGLLDERSLFVLGRSVAGLRDPARLPAAAEKFDSVRTALRARGMDHLAGAWSLFYFNGRIDYFLRRWDHGREVLEQALALSQRWNGTDNIRELNSWIDLGNMWFTPRDSAGVARGMECWRRAVELSQKLPATFTNDPNVMRMNIAQSIAEAGQVRVAREDFAAVWKAYRDRDGEAFRLCSFPAFLAARASRALGDTAQAELWYRRALRPFEVNDSGEREDVALVRESMALFEFWRGREDEAFAMGWEAGRLRRQVVEETAPWLPDADALNFANNRRNVHGLVTTLALRTGPETAARRAGAWEMTARSRGLVLESMLARVRAQADTTSEGLELGKMRRDLANQVLAALRAPDTREQSARRDSLRTVLRHRELGAAATHFATDSITAEGAAARLGADGVLVSYSRFPRYDRADSKRFGWVARETYAAFVLRGGESAPDAIELAPAESLDAAVAAYRKALLAGGDSPAARAAGEKLRALAWDPVVAALRGRTQVYVVPDGELQKINWYALPSGRDHWLVDEPFVLHRLPSERDLFVPARAPGEGLLAFGGLDYGDSPQPQLASATPVRRSVLPSCRSFFEERFAPLPASLGEARAVSALGRRFTRDTTRVTLLTGAAANEEAFKRQAPGRRVVHLATHAFFLGADCANGAAAADVLARNPLVFSGIALANANRWREAGAAGAGSAAGAEDGLLTAEELAGMRLDGVEWLVLSGCESGMGQVQAWEGVFGLPRAARQAGVRTLVMSLLPVDDDASRVWMQSLYEAHFGRGEPTALAVRTASRRVLSWLRTNGRAGDPRLWGAFVALGE